MNLPANISNSARKYVETRDEKNIVEALYKLVRELEKLEKESLDQKPSPCAVVKMVDLAITLAPMY